MCCAVRHVCIFLASLKQHSNWKTCMLYTACKGFFSDTNVIRFIEITWFCLLKRRKKQKKRRENPTKLNDNDVSTKSTTQECWMLNKLLDLNIANNKSHRLCFIFILNWKWFRQSKHRHRSSFNSSKTVKINKKYFPRWLLSVYLWKSAVWQIVLCKA